MGNYPKIVGVQGTKRPSDAEFKFMGVYENRHDNVHDTLMSLAQEGRVMIKSGEDVAYLADIRADYVNKRISVPIVRKKIHNEDPESFRKGVYYEFREEDFEIYSVENGFIEDLYILPNGLSVFLDGMRFYKLELTGLRMYRELRESDREAKDLFDRYVPYAAGEYSTEYRKFRYERIGRSGLFQNEREYLKRHGLNFYGEYKEFKEYRDVRMYNMEELVENFSMEELKMEQDYNLTRMEFELELLTRILGKQYWKNWTRGEFENIINGKFEYVKYKDRGVSLIFKRRWV